MASEIFVGDITQVVLPSGKIVDIRENNGGDDELLSKISSAKNGENINIFLSGIIEKDYELEKKPLAGDVAGYLNKDRYYLMFKQRLINYGNILKYKYKGDRDEQEYEYEEDLTTLDGNLGDSEYKPKSGEQISKYPFGNQRVIEFTTSKKKKFRFHVVDGIMEYQATKADMDDYTKNTPLYERQIEEFVDGKWQRVFHFKHCSSREVAEVRTFVEKCDEQFQPIISFKSKEGNFYQIPLFSIPTFFYPEAEIEITM